jgi:hypothetical protein
MAGQSIWVSIALHELNGSVTSTSMSMSSISQQWQHDRMGWFTITAPNPLVVQQQHVGAKLVPKGGTNTTVLFSSEGARTKESLRRTTPSSITTLPLLLPLLL